MIRNSQYLASLELWNYPKGLNLSFTAGADSALRKCRTLSTSLTCDPHAVTLFLANCPSEELPPRDTRP